MNKKGYTLVEILVVVAIIGFLAAAAVYAVNVARIKGRDAKRMADLEQIRKAMEIYYDDNKEYPGTNGVYYRNPSCTWNILGTNEIPDILPSSYLNPIPDDPRNNNAGGCYFYGPQNNKKGYIIIMYPEDYKAVGSGMGCFAVVPNWYCVGENFN